MRFTPAKSLPLILLFSTAALPAFADESAQNFNGFLGAGVSVQPKYTGSKHNETRFLPVARLNYGPFFFGGVDTLTALGWQFARTEHWTFSVGAGLDLFPREESDDDYLRGMGDIKRSPHAFTSAIYRNDLFNAGVILTQDIGGNQQGFRLTSYANLSWRPSEDLRLFTGPSLSWANSDYMQTQYGVSAQQSSRSGFSRYDARSGLEKIGWEVGMDYDMTAAWQVGARVMAQRLESDAADSPLTQQKDQVSYALFLAWRF